MKFVLVCIPCFFVGIESSQARHKQAGLFLEKATKDLDVQNSTKTNASCPLPGGAKWCTGIMNGKTRQVAVYSANDPVSNSICASGSWEFASVSQSGIHESGMDKTFLDIGANIGWVSVVFADAGYKVLAVEPMLANRQVLQATLCQNPDLTPKIEIVPVALAQKPTQPGQTCDVYSAEVNVGDGLLVCDGEEARRRDIVNNPHFRHVWREAVSTMTLDQWMVGKGSPSVDVIKMDVEGYECKVLEGASQTFNKPKYIIAEVRANTAPCVMSPLKAHGYVARQHSFAGPPVPQHAQLTLTDIFFSRG
mmetsp:Transcript_32319/g.57195  ORF Transcript_32319/g.57195 Transcript_32319/m.57195 type:complete len:307 (-) Transcript_32319:78-998(-)